MGPLPAHLLGLLLSCALPLGALERPEMTPQDAQFIKDADANTLFDYYEKGIVEEKNPYASQFFLAAAPAHERMRAADEDRFDTLFRKANELADLSRLLNEHAEPGTLREALAARHDLPLLRDPAAFAQWTKKEMPYLPENTVRTAVFEWNTLGKPLKAALVAKKVTPGDWAKMPFSQRNSMVSEFSTGALQEMLKTVPHTRKEMDALHARAKSLGPLLEKDELNQMWEHFNRANDAVTGLEEARKLAGSNADPKLKAALAAAGKAGDLDSMLTQLGTVFDGLKGRAGGVEPEAATAVRRAAPGTPEQKFTPEQRVIYTEMLRHSLLEEMKGTTAGDKLRDFYKKEPFNLVVRPMGNGVMGQYQSQTNEVSVSEDLILKYVREHGLKAEDLINNPEVFKSVSQAVLSTVLHEGIHQEQEAWRRDKDLPHWYVVEHEVEAKSREAAFVLEKSAKDPAYAKFMAENQDLSFVKEAALIAQGMRRDPAAFGPAIRTRYYPGVVTVETQARWAAEDPKVTREVQEGLAKESQRRARLSPAELAALDAQAAPSKDGMVDSAAEAVALISTFKTADLNARLRIFTENLAQAERGRPRAASDYAAYIARDRQTRLEVGTVLAGIDTPLTPALAIGTGGGSPPPPPGAILARPRPSRP